jgi:Acetohydroxy acid isomeroreductase, NADPH-binding domain
MSARLFYDKDCSLAPLSNKTIVFIGYGNQGRAQALNLRDTLKSENLSSLPKIVIANNKDSYANKADEDGFGFTSDWSKAAVEADVLFLLVPDQVLLTGGYMAKEKADGLTGPTRSLQRPDRAIPQEIVLHSRRLGLQRLLQASCHPVLQRRCHGGATHGRRLCPIALCQR